MTEIRIQVRTTGVVLNVEKMICCRSVHNDSHRKAQQVKKLEVQISPWMGTDSECRSAKYIKFLTCQVLPASQKPSWHKQSLAHRGPLAV
jgi:hypothetical protein